MKIIDYVHNITPSYMLPDYFNTYCQTDNIVFFDIETTGLSARNSTLYLIGALWFDHVNIHIRQWFNEDGYSEASILQSFDEFCRGYSHIAHFNGTTFDIPYLNQKADILGYEHKYWTSLSQIDIYKEIRPYKKLFLLENMKQVSIEKFLGIQREDTYTGKELINIYQRYISRPGDDNESILLLHNHDDLLGMPAVSCILSYKSLFENPGIIGESINYEYNDITLHIECRLDFPHNIPRRILFTSKNGIYINACDDNLIIEIPIVKDELKHYFSDYQNYYYLPKEDMAIHKSVAAYVEPENRQKATKATCYIKKSGVFIPFYGSERNDIFRNKYNERINYVILDSILTDSIENQIKYITDIIKETNH